MAEQPQVLRSLAGRRRAIAEQIAELVGPSAPAGVVFAARGSSANASLFGRQAIGVAIRRPAMLASLSLGSAYGIEVDYSGWVSIATSQSGRTPEIVAALQNHRAGGARTIAITNSAGSPLSLAADLGIDLDAGAELAVPATKSLTAQLAAFWIVASALGGDADCGSDDTWHQLVRSVTECLADPEPVVAVAQAMRATRSLVVCGRGFGHPAAREGALKIKEVTGITAEAYSHLELLHGPIAVVGADVPALVVSLDGPTGADAQRVIAELGARGATSWIVGDRPGAHIPVPPGLPEAFTAIVAVVRLQQLAHLLAVDRGIDPDQPNRLSKITYT